MLGGKEKRRTGERKRERKREKKRGQTEDSHEWPKERIFSQ